MPKTSTKTLSRRYVTLLEAAEYLGVNPRTLRRRIADGSLAGHRLPPGRLIRVDLNDVDALFRPIPAGDRIA